MQSIPSKLKNSGGKTSLQLVLDHLFLASLTLGYLWYYSSTAHTANDDKDKENTAGRSLEHCKGRFVSKGHLDAVKHLAKGKDNVKRPTADEYNGEKDYEATEKKK